MKNKIKFILSIFIISVFIISCSKEDKVKKADENVTPGIKILNESSISNSKIESWTSYASKKMKDQNADILAVSWDVGDFVKEAKPFNQHKVLLSNDQIEKLMTGISEWLDKSCLGNNGKKEELEKFRGYIENGADASSQFDICPKFRIILMGFTKDMNEESKQSLVIHELYHAFQQDLSDESCRKLRDKSKSNHKWVIEGGAEYFAKVVTGEMNNKDGVSALLKQAYENYNEDKDSSISGSGIAGRGAGGVRLMIERGWLKESEVLDGSFFHSCSSENDWSDDNSNVSKIKNLWYLIEEKNGKYVFTKAALEG